MSQEELAHSIGLTYQQVQKYESGKNRITVSRLFDIAGALKVPADYFYQDLCPYSRPGRGKGVSDAPQAPFEGDPFAQKDVMELVAAYLKIEDPRLRKSLLETAKAMAACPSLK